MRSFFAQKIRAELALRARASSIGNVICIVLAAYTCQVHLRHFDLGTVSSLLTLAASIGRIRCAYNAKDPRDQNYSWQKRYAFWVVLNGLGWGVFSVWSISAWGLGSFRTQNELLVLSGITSASLVSLGAWNLICRVFFSLALLPVTCLLSVQEFGRPEGIFAVAMIIYYVFLLSLSRIQYRALRTGMLRAYRSKIEHERTKAVIDAFPGLVSQINPNLRYQFMNRGLRSFLGLDDQRTRGARVGSMNGTNDPITQALIKFSQSPEISRHTQEVELTSSGQPRWHLLTIARLNDQARGGILCVALDIHDKKTQQTEVELQRAKALSNAKMASLGEMAAGIAHEINNPLAVVKGWLGMARMRVENGDLNHEKLIDGLTRSERQCDRIAKIVKNMRILSRNAENDPMVPVPLSQILQDVLDTCQSKFESNQVALILPQPEGLASLTVNCRGTEIAQVLINLLSNALDAVATASRKQVEISVYSTESEVSIRVIDSGPGVPEALREKIMQPFFTTKEVGRGTGLGLSISSSIANAHGGKLTLDLSSPHTCFVLTLPVKADAILPFPAAA